MLKIYFRLPFTEYFLAKDIKLCLARKVWIWGKTGSKIYNKGENYGFIKV